MTPENFHCHKSVFLPPGCMAVYMEDYWQAFEFKLPPGYRRISFAPTSQDDAHDWEKHEYNLYFPPTVCRIMLDPTRIIIGRSSEMGIRYVEWTAEYQGKKCAIPLPNISGSGVCMGEVYGDTIAEALETVLAQLGNNFNLDMGWANLGRLLGVEDSDEYEEDEDWDYDSFFWEWERTPPELVGHNWQALPSYRNNPYSALVSELGRRFGLGTRAKGRLTWTVPQIESP